MWRSPRRPLPEEALGAQDRGGPGAGDMEILGCQELAGKLGRNQPGISLVSTCPLGPAWLSENGGQSK